MITILGLFTLFLLPVFAEEISTSNIDDLLLRTDKIRSSNPLEFSSSLKKLNQVKNLSVNQNYFLKYLNAYNYAFTGNYEKAIKISKEIMESNASDNIKFRANLTLLNTFSVTKNWAAGMSYLSENNRLYPQFENEELYQMGVLASLHTYNLYQQHTRVIELSEKLSSVRFTPRNKCMKSLFVLEAKLKLNLLIDYSPEINKGIKVCEKINEHAMASLIRLYLAIFYLNENDPTRALDVLLIHLPNMEKASYPRLTIELYSTVATAFFHKDNINRAEEFALKAVNYTQGLETTKPVVDAYQLLYTIEKSRGNTSAALTYHEKYTTADKAYMDEVSAKQVAFQLAQHKQAEQAQQIQYLDEKNNLLEIEKELVEARDRNNKLLVALLTAVVIILMLIVYRIKVSNKKLRELAEFDVLTGAYNRGHFAQEANTAISYCKKTEQEISLVLFDLDYFKLINDRHGHACGDWALRQTIETCRTIGRKNDVFARLGGEEFCILLPTCDATAATLLAEQCRKEIAEIDSTPSGFDFTITASFGVTCAKTSGYTLETLLANADQAMYKSKNNGRNRVTLFSED